MKERIKEYAKVVGRMGAVLSIAYGGCLAGGVEAQRLIAEQTQNRIYAGVSGGVPPFPPQLLFPNRIAEAAEGTEFHGDVWTISGVPARVARNQVDQANLGRGFNNSLFGGSEMLLAEPGVLKVGWDFPQDQFKAAGEHIYHYDPGNQAVLDNPEASWNVQEGGFAMFNGNAMIIKVSGIRLEIGGPEGNQNIVMIRGLYPDGSRTDRNRIAHLTGYTAGAVVADMYPRGGFISQKHFEQIAKNALTNNPNCGAEGCRTVRAYFLDLNTGAFAVMVRPGLDKSWEMHGNNWL